MALTLYGLMDRDGEEFETPSESSKHAGFAFTSDEKECYYNSGIVYLR